MLAGLTAMKRAVRKQVVEVRRQVTAVRDFVVSRSEALQPVFFGGAMPRQADDWSRATQPNVLFVDLECDGTGCARCIINRLFI
jgi:hypothetical protein